MLNEKDVQLGREFIDEIGDFFRKHEVENKEEILTKLVYNEFVKFLKQKILESPKKVAIGIALLVDIFNNPLLLSSVVFEFITPDVFVQKLSKKLLEKAKENDEEYLLGLAIKIYLYPLVREKILEIIKD